MDGVIRVALVDDHPLFRTGVLKALEGLAQFQVVAEGACADDAIRIAQDHSPEVLLLDVHMPGDGLVALRRLARSHPKMKIIMLTVSAGENTVVDAMKAGAAGYALKGITGKNSGYIDPQHPPGKMRARSGARRMHACPAGSGQGNGAGST